MHAVSIVITIVSSHSPLTGHVAASQCANVQTSIIERYLPCLFQTMKGKEKSAYMWRWYESKSQEE